MNESLYEQKKDIFQNNALNAIVAHSNQTEQNFHVDYGNLIKRENILLRRNFYKVQIFYYHNVGYFMPKVLETLGRKKECK